MRMGTLSPMNDFLLPSMPGAAPQQGYPQQQAAAPLPLGQAPAAARAPGRPGEDPIRQEERAVKHAEKRRLESALPPRAMDSKVLIYRRPPGAARVPHGTKPLLTVLIGELEEAQKAGQSTDDYIQTRITDVLTRKGKPQQGTFECTTVDKRGQRIGEIPTFDVIIGDDAGEDGSEDMGDQGSDGGDDGEGDVSLEDIPEEELEALLAEKRARRGDPQAQFHRAQMGPPPPPSAVNPVLDDEILRRNRDEAKQDAQGTMAMLMQAMQSQAAAQAQQSQQNMQLMMTMFQTQAQQAQHSNSEKGGTTVALVTALMPLVQKLLEPKEDKNGPLLQAMMLKLFDSQQNNGGMMKEFPTMMAEVAKQQMTLQGIGAQNAMSVQQEVNKMVTSQLMGLIKDGLKPKEEPAEDKGSMLGDIAKIAGAVLPALMGKQDAPAETAPYEAQPAMSMQPVEQPLPPEPAAPPPVRAAPPAVPRATATATAVPERRNDPNARIRGLLNAVADLRFGTIASDQYWGVVQFINKHAPPAVAAAIMAESTDDIIKSCSEAVLASPSLLQWVADADNRDFLTDTLKDAKLLKTGVVTEAYAEERVQALVQLRQQLEAEASPERARTPKDPPPAAPEAPTVPQTPEAAPPAANQATG